MKFILASVTCFFLQTSCFARSIPVLRTLSPRALPGSFAKNMVMSTRARFFLFHPLISQTPSGGQRPESLSGNLGKRCIYHLQPAQHSTAIGVSHLSAVSSQCARSRAHKFSDSSFSDSSQQDEGQYFQFSWCVHDVKCSVKVLPVLRSFEC